MLDSPASAEDLDQDQTDHDHARTDQAVLDLRLVHLRDQRLLGVVGQPLRVGPHREFVEGVREPAPCGLDLPLDGLGISRHVTLLSEKPRLGGTVVSRRLATHGQPTCPGVYRPHAVGPAYYGGGMTENHRLSPGDTAPAFTLPDADGKEVSLSDYSGRKVIIYFYPAASTPGCTKQACDFRDSLAELNEAGLEVVGISPDKPAKLAKFRDAEGLTFPLLSDPDRAVLQAYGAFGEKTMYGKTVTGVIRSTFLVDESGKIEVAQYNVKAAHTTINIDRILGKRK